MLAICVSFAGTASAQLVTYEFTGEFDQAYGTRPGSGQTIVGTLTLDLNAPVTTSSATQGRWDGGALSIDAITSDGWMAGTSRGQSRPVVFTQNVITGESIDRLLNVEDRPGTQPDDGLPLHRIEFVGFTTRTAVEIPDPWNIVAPATPAQPNRIDLIVYDEETDTEYGGIYTVTSFNVATNSTIVIDGIDTGIDDFEYEGQLLSELLADIADASENPCDYADSVTELALELLTAGYLTEDEFDVLVALVTQPGCDDDEDDDDDDGCHGRGDHRGHGKGKGHDRGRGHGRFNDHGRGNDKGKGKNFPPGRSSGRGRR
ncbi:MAG: hypothetical protein KDA81_11215 [Planctomycetaceae bacterium]|nr:hypothetical protein [Planctomycetaceae bacterium]